MMGAMTGVSGRLRLPALLLAVALSAAASGVARAQVGRPDAGTDAKGNAVMELKLTDLGALTDITLQGVVDQGEISFGIPDHWRLDAEPELILRLSRSSVLIPDISLVVVALDERPIATVRLDGAPEQPWERTLKIPLPAKAPGYHTLRFRAYHRSHLPCEIDDHPGLWSRILGDSSLRIPHRVVAPELNLAAWPYPFRDERDLAPRPVVLVLRPNPSAEEIKAAGYVSSLLAMTARWRAPNPLVHLGALSSAPPGNAIVLGRSDAPETLGDVIALLDRGGDEGRDAAASVRARGWPASGLMALGPRPGAETDSVLGLAGKDGKGLVDLALLLTSRDGRTLPTGTIQRIEEVKAPTPMEPRRWANTLPPEARFQLKELGFKDTTTRGWRGGVVTIPLRIIPDEHVEQGKARFDVSYSYSAQVDQERSRIDVLLNDATIGGAALTELNGQSRASISVELPANEIGPDSKVYVVFQLVPRTKVCIGTNHVPMWGTVHSDSTLTVPRERGLVRPDLGLLRFGGFPFGIGPDYANTRIVLPRAPTLPDLQMYAWWTAELGRVSRGDRFAYKVSLGSTEGSTEEDLLVVDSGLDAELLRATSVFDKMAFASVEDHNMRFAFATGAAATLKPDPDSAFFEALVLPGSLHDRSAVISYAPKADVFTRVGKCVSGMLLDNLHGRVARAGNCPELAEIAVAVDPKQVGKKPVAQADGGGWRARLVPAAGVGVGTIIVFLGVAYLVNLRRKRKAAAAAAAAEEEDGGGTL